jgi:hypothetical protein
LEFGIFRNFDIRNVSDFQNEDFFRSFRTSEFLITIFGILEF